MLWWLSASASGPSQNPRFDQIDSISKPIGPAFFSGCPSRLCLGVPAWEWLVFVWPSLHRRRPAASDIPAQKILV